jgi:pimeloyl-ACP methyl ester carboxylesterase
MACELTDRVRAWESAGETTTFRDYNIHVHHRDGASPCLVLLHGFPTSSFDWSGFLQHEREHAALGFDFLGFGLSDKPARHAYSLHWQADLTEELVRRHVDDPVFVVAHDMGTSVATELMARDLEGALGFELIGALLFNGSIILELAKPTPAQKLLRSPLGPLSSKLARERVFRHQFGSVFSAAHPLGREDAADHWSLISCNNGHRIGHRLVHYMSERQVFAERWHGAVRDWPKPLFLLWGMQDPVARPAVLDGLRELRPHAAVTELPDVGHYPQLEAPEQLLATLDEALASLPGTS